jgi:DNA-binding transcriptional MerR regulator
MPKQQLPTSTEKLAFKFIIDEMKEEIISNHANEDIHPALVDTTTQNDIREIVTTQLQKQVEELIPSNYKPIELAADKKYFRVGEVSTLIGVEPYVLRYWETEFTVLKPEKQSSGHRVYTRKDVETLHYIKYLLHTEKYSLKGARAKLKEEKQMGQSFSAGSKVKNTELLKELSKELKDLIAIARGVSGSF